MKAKICALTLYILLLSVSIIQAGGEDISPKGTISALYPISDRLIDERFALWALVKNTGNVNLGSGCLVEFWVKDSGMPHGSVVGSRKCTVNDYLASNPNSGDLRPGEVRWYRVYFTPSRVGDFEFWAVVKNDDKRISEWASEKFRVVSDSSKGQVTSLYPVNDQRLGERIALWAYVENTGSVNLGSGCLVEFWVKSPGMSDDSMVGSRKCTVNDYLASNPNSGDLRPGELRWYRVYLNPSKVGDYSYWAIVESDGKRISGWSSEGKFAIKDKVLSASVTRLWPVEGKVVGDSVNLWAEVDNTGNVGLDKSCYVRFWVRGPGLDKFVGSRHCTENDYTKSNPNTGVFTSGEGVRWFKVSWTPQKSGSYTYWVIVENDDKSISAWSVAAKFSIR